MSENHFQFLFVTVAAGLGLFLIGLAGLLSMRRSWGCQLLSHAAAAGVSLGLLAWLNRWECGLPVASILGAAFVGHMVLASRWWILGTVQLLQRLQQPVVRYALMLMVGPGVALVGIVHYEHKEEQILDAVMNEMMLIHGVAGNVQVRHAFALTDRGRRIPLGEPIEVRNAELVGHAERRYLESTQRLVQLIQLAPPHDGSNCHGWVFTGGRYLISGTDVPTILEDNGYYEVADPQPNDLAVYYTAYTADHAVSHTAIVRYVTPGQPILVEGKWGNLGVYLHPAEQSPYGSVIKYYRAARANHLLRIVTQTELTAPCMPYSEKTVSVVGKPMPDLPKLGESFDNPQSR
jgi:hypothetical protein